MSRRFGTRRPSRTSAATGGASVEYPSTLSPYIWLEADVGVTESASRVSAWASQVNSITLTQATGANKPLYVTSDAGYNNKPVIHFDDDVRFINNTSISVPFPCSTFEYGEVDGTGLYCNGLIAATDFLALWSRAGGDQFYYATDSGVQDIWPGIPDAVGKRSLYRGATAGVVTLARDAGTPVAATNTKVPTGQTAVQIKLGYQVLAQPQKIAAYFVFTRELSGAERTALHAWCVAKYG